MEDFLNARCVPKVFLIPGGKTSICYRKIHESHNRSSVVGDINLEILDMLAVKEDMTCEELQISDHSDGHIWQGLHELHQEIPCSECDNGS